MGSRKILIDISFLLKNKTGTGFYTLLLLKLLKRLNLSFETVECKIPDGLSFRGIWHNIWLNTFFYLKTLIDKTDIAFFPAFITPFLKRKGTIYVTTIHDLLSFSKEFTNRYVELLYKFAVYVAIKKSDVILTDSNTVKNELMEKFNLPSSRIEVLYIALSDVFLNMDLRNEKDILKKYDLLDKKYILSGAWLRKRKNIPSLVKAFESISDDYPDLKLVLVGSISNEEKALLTNNKNVIFTGYAKDEELPVLYKNALLFVYPSLYEGFGIPILEAQSCGTPLLLSDIPVLREVAGDAAIFCEPTTEGIFEKLKEILQDQDMQKQLIEKGYNNIKRFDEDIICNQFQQIIKDLEKRKDESR